MKKILVILCLILAFLLSFSTLPTDIHSETGYSVSITGGAVMSGSYNIVPSGTNITIKAGNSLTGRKFYRWDVISPQELTLEDPYSDETVFIMPDTNVELRAIFILPETVMPVEDFVEKCIDVANNYKTLYVMGCFGAPLNETNKKRYSSNYSYNADPERTAMINAATNDTFGFDCVCFIKGILWGWNGDIDKVYGGASYASNGVPDINADQMMRVCTNVSSDFNCIEFGEAVGMPGHIGVYIGNGLAVECTPKWDNQVQITACNCSIEGYNRRNWSNHGKLPYLDYEADSIVENPTLYNVIFVIMNHGSIVPMQTVPSGGFVSPVYPNCDGWEFAGWYSDFDLTMPFDFTTPISSGLTLYAKWIENEGTDTSFNEETDYTDDTDDTGDTTETTTDTEHTQNTSLRGDVSGDGVLNVRDVAMMMRAISGWIQDNYHSENEDFNADGKFNARDIALLMRTLTYGDYIPIE